MKAIPENRDLLNDNGLDEMQKSYAYKLAFKCFKALYWTAFIISFIMLSLATAIEDSAIFAICALVLELATCVVYVIFGAKASKVGAVNQNFVVYMTNPITIIGYFVMAACFIIMYVRNFMEEGELFFVFYGLYLVIILAANITLGFIVKKNSKVIEEDKEE